jgi:hypothetical protein
VARPVKDPSLCHALEVPLTTHSTGATQSLSPSFSR